MTRLARIEINRPELRRIHGDVMGLVDAAGFVVQNEMIRLTTLVDGASAGIVRDRQTGRRVRRLRYGTRRSKRGESPYKQTGQLSQSIATERDPVAMSVRVGPGVRYGAILEIGLDRPFIRKSLENMESEVRRVFRSR